MPVIAVNLSPNLFASMMRFVEEERYASVEQFLEVAASNQLALERGATVEEVIARGQRRQAQDTNGRKERTRSPREGRKTATKSGRGARNPKADRLPQPTPIMPEAVARALDQLDRDQALKVLPTALDGTPLPPGQHLFSQLNRLFGLKIACRFLACNAAQAEEWPRFSEIRVQLALGAATIGSSLAQEDVARQRKRDECLATGLPRCGNTPSQQRFLDLFIARATQGGSIHPGAIVQLGLAAVAGDRLGLTAAGQAFARLPSPALDAGPTVVTATLNPEEQEFLREQLSNFVPAERAAWDAVCQAIQNDGCNKPEHLMAAVKQQFPASWTLAVLRGHLAGVIARMVEAGLLRRRWEGRSVSYELVGVNCNPIAMEECPNAERYAIQGPV